MNSLWESKSVICREDKLLPRGFIQAVQVLGYLTDVFSVDSLGEGECSTAQLSVLLHDLLVEAQGLVERRLSCLAFELILRGTLVTCLRVDVPLDLARSSLLR